MRLIFSAILAAALVFGGTLFLAGYLDGISLDRVKGLGKPLPERDSETRAADEPDKIHDFPARGLTGVSCLHVPSGDYRPPEVMVRKSPIAPQLPLHYWEDHTVVVEFCIEANGVPSEIKIFLSEPTDRWDAVAVTAMSEWRFQAAEVDGKRVKVCGCQNTFNMEQEHDD